MLTITGATGRYGRLVIGRTIWPISLGFVEGNRFVAGWCELRHDFRLFRIDRIARAKLTADRYPGRRRDLVKQWRLQVAEAEAS